MPVRPVLFESDMGSEKGVSLWEGYYVFDSPLAPPGMKARKVLASKPGHYRLMTFLNVRFEILSFLFFLSIKFLKHSVTRSSISWIYSRNGG